MAKTRGKVGVVAISSNGTTYTAIGKRTDGSYTIDTDVIDSTDCDSTDKESIYGDQQLKADFTARYDSADAGQTALMAAVAAKSDQYFRIYPQGTGTGLPSMAAMCRITSASVDIGMGNVAELKVSIESTGAITETAQS